MYSLLYETGREHDGSREQSSSHASNHDDNLIVVLTECVKRAETGRP